MEQILCFCNCHKISASGGSFSFQTVLRDVIVPSATGKAMDSLILSSTTTRSMSLFGKDSLERQVV